MLLDTTIAQDSRGPDGLGNLILVVAAAFLEAFHESDVLLLGLLGGVALIGGFLPGVLLGLALLRRRGQHELSLSRCDVLAYLEVEHSGRGGLGDVLAAGDLEESCGGFEVSLGEQQEDPGSRRGEYLYRRGRGVRRYQAWR